MSAFREYVTSTAFHLTLSRAQIEAISHFDQRGASWCHLNTASALIAKGLIERHYLQDGSPFSVILTEAGRALIPLLKLSGLYVELPPIPPAVELEPAKIKLREPA